MIWISSSNLEELSFPKDVSLVEARPLTFGEGMQLSQTFTKSCHL